jgi:methionine-rich copper-binding protein CopC
MTARATGTPGRLSSRAQMAGAWWRVYLPVALAVAVASSVLPAAAHARLVSSAPAAGETVAQPPAELLLIFDENLGAGSTLVVYAGMFQPLDGTGVSIEGPHMRATLAEPLQTGTYTVEWTAVTDDGHRVGGSYQFSVQADSTEPAAAAWPWLVGVGGVALLVVLGYWIRRRSGGRSVV